MATPEEVAIQRQVEQDKVIAWSLQNGIKNSSDLAFFFLCYDEALQEAGRAVADAWQAARADSTQGLAVAARQVMALGASPPAAVSKPSTLPRNRQTADRPDRIVKGASLPASAFETGSSPQAVGANQLMAVMLAFNEHRPETEADKEALRAFVLTVAQKPSKSPSAMLSPPGKNSAALPLAVKWRLLS